MHYIPEESVKVIPARQLISPSTATTSLRGIGKDEVGPTAVSTTLQRRKLKTRVRGPQLLEGMSRDVKGSDFACYVVVIIFSAHSFH